MQYLNFKIKIFTQFYFGIILITPIWIYILFCIVTENHLLIIYYSIIFVQNILFFKMHVDLMT